jgi:FkbM family methyltransferase
LARLQSSFDTVELEVYGHRIRLPDLPRYRKFYAKLKSGQWEPRTFNALAQHLDKSTTYVDIGAWIGVTAFWASNLAKRVIALEPDPFCNEILELISPHYPNVVILNGALTPEPVLKLNAVSDFGSSETTALDIGDGEFVSVTGYSIGAIMKRAGEGPFFVKIDIEGYEYKVMNEIGMLAGYELRGTQCAVHPQLFEKSLAGPLLWRRLYTLIETYRLWRMLKRLCPFFVVPRYGSMTRYLLSGILLRRTPKGTDFVVTAIPPPSHAKGRKMPVTRQS